MINIFSNKEILNIITNNLLDKIYIIEQNDFVFICPYSKFYTYKKVKDSLRKKNNNFNSKKNRYNPEEIQINIPKKRININTLDDDIFNTEDKFENKSISFNANK